MVLGWGQEKIFFYLVGLELALRGLGQRMLGEVPDDLAGQVAAPLDVQVAQVGPESGVAEGGFTIMLHPAPKPGPSFHDIRAIG